MPCSIENDKACRYGLDLPALLSSLSVQQFVFNALPKSWQGLWTVEGCVILQSWVLLEENEGPEGRQK